MTTPNLTLQNKVRFGHAYAARKHDLSPNPERYADREIDRLSNSDFLELLSCAMEELFNERAGK